MHWICLGILPKPKMELELDFPTIPIPSPIPPIRRLAKSFSVAPSNAHKGISALTCPISMFLWCYNFELSCYILHTAYLIFPLNISPDIFVIPITTTYDIKITDSRTLTL